MSLLCQSTPLEYTVGHLHKMIKNNPQRTFVVWPLTLIAITLLFVAGTYWLVAPSKVLVGAAVIFGALHSLSTMEELTGGRELTWITLPLILAGDGFLTLWAFPGESFFQNSALFLQFLAIVMLSESVMVFMMRTRLQTFCERRQTNKFTA